MAMQSPEILLSSLNEALRRLRGACTDISNEEIDEKLLEVMRRLLLAETLGNTWILAMGGSQGAGKTTLMASLYDLRGQAPNWLQSNEGRGEKMPVLIKEVEGLQTPQGYVRRLARNDANQGFSLVDVKVEVAEFQRAICDPEAADLLPVLQVPPRYFNRPNQAWLLLPGYEKQERANRSWQELMRQAMIAAGGCVIVTDETRMANQQQLEIVKDMLKNELDGLKPYIVISKTEAHRNNPQRLEDLRSSAQGTFQVSPEHTKSHIIFSGTDDAEYIKEWMPQLRIAIEDLNKAGDSNRAAQLSHLSEIIGKDLTRVLTAIRSKSKLYFSSDKSGTSDGAEVLDQVLLAFDDATEELRKAHHKIVADLVSKTYSEAISVMDNRLEREHEGFRNWISNAFDTNSETKRKMQELVQGSWRQAQPRLFTNYAKSLETLTLGRLGRMPANEDVSLEYNAGNLSPEAFNKRVQLGYSHASGEVVKFKQLTLDRVNDIKTLLGDSSNQVEQAQGSVSKQLAYSVALIPVISLEYSRLFYALPEATGLKTNSSRSPNLTGIDTSLITEGVESLGAGVALGKTAIRSLAGVLAVDVLSDGDADILGAIFGQSPGDNSGSSTSSIPAPITLHPAAVAATAVVAAAYLTTRAVSGLRSMEKEASAQAYRMLGAVHDHHVNHLKKQFDETMAVSRSRIKEKIRTRYCMDEILMRKDRLAKAIADVMSITSDLRHELDSSASGLQIFGTTRSV